MKIDVERQLTGYWGARVTEPSGLVTVCNLFHNEQEAREWAEFWVSMQPELARIRAEVPAAG